MDKQVWTYAAAWLAEQEMPLLPLFDEEPDSQVISCLQQTAGGALVQTSAQVLACKGLDPRSIFLKACASEKELHMAHGHCRYLAENAEEIKKLDGLVGQYLPEGYLEDIAIRVDPNGSGEFTPETIPTFARLIRRTDNLAVRAVFLPFDQNGDLSRQAKDAYSLVKKIRSDLPCMLHAFCFEGLLKPLMQGDSELLKTMQMLASLNDTSLYASFFIS